MWIQEGNSSGVIRRFYYSGMEYFSLHPQSLCCALCFSFILSFSGNESSPRRLSSITSFGLQRIPSPRHPSPLVIDSSRKGDENGKKEQIASEPISPLVKSPSGSLLFPRRLHRTVSMPPRIITGEESPEDGTKPHPTFECSGNFKTSMNHWSFYLSKIQMLFPL